MKCLKAGIVESNQKCHFLGNGLLEEFRNNQRPLLVNGDKHVFLQQRVGIA
jgi:hypothetical protein